MTKAVMLPLNTIVRIICGIGVSRPEQILICSKPFGVAVRELTDPTITRLVAP
jgi:hypothetical protein